MTVFRPCIDLHNGHVKQIVGGTLRDSGAGPTENFVSEHSAGHYGRMYKHDGLHGGHVIKLGPGNEEAAKEALAAFPGGMQLGGGVTPDAAKSWLDAGASHVIVTSYLFVDGELSMARVEEMARVVGPERLVIDLSCRRKGDGYLVATDRWQTITRTAVDARTLRDLADHCSEYLVHAADVEGKCEGIEEELVRLLGDSCPLPCTYAGGGKALDDLARVKDLSGGRVDLTFGSALDIFGGSGVKYADCLIWNRAQTGD